MVELAPGERVHAFDCFALVNVLLCSAVRAGSTTGASSPAMRHSCLRHFEATLLVLDPTVVVLQGAGVAEWTRVVFEPAEQVAEHAWRFQWGERPAHLARFAHPTARGAQLWSNLTGSCLQDVVVPTLKAARAD